MKKIVGIFVMMLLITSTVLPVLGTMNEENNRQSACLFINNPEPNDPPSQWLKGSDQTQTSCGDYGFVINPIFLCSQEFKPSKETLTAVALPFFKFGSPPSGATITVTIREELDGTDLISKSIDADDKRITGNKITWVLFDFDDITVLPEEPYYIVCTADKGNFDENDDNNTNIYCWPFDFDNKYDRGIAFQSNDSGQTWVDLENPWDDPEYVECDFAFITYHQKPENIAYINTFIIRFLENHPLMFPLLRQLFNQ